MLGRSPFTPFTAALEEAPALPALTTSLAKAIASALRLPLAPAAPLPAEVLRRAGELRDEKYASRDWTELR